MKRTVVLAIVGLLAGSVAVGAPAAASARVATTTHVVEIDYSSPTVSITTSTHKKLKFFVSGRQDPAGNSKPSEVDVNVETRNGVESHDWSFPLKAGALRVNAATARGKVVTGRAQLGSFGQLTLTFKPTGKAKTQHCGGGTIVVTRRLLVSGAVSFATHSAGAHSWGSFRFGSARKKQRFAGRGDIEVTSGGGSCPVAPANRPCQTILEWDAVSGNVSLQGGWTLAHGREVGEVVGVRELVLPSPSGAGRFDEVAVPAPPPGLSVSGGKPTLVITTDGGGASGSAVMASPTAAAPNSVPCARIHDETIQGWNDASFVNGDTPLTIREQIEGRIGLANQTTDGGIGQARQTD
jgi:hypothetical protein